MWMAKRKKKIDSIPVRYVRIYCLNPAISGEYSTIIWVFMEINRRK